MRQTLRIVLLVLVALAAFPAAAQTEGGAQVPPSPPAQGTPPSNPALEEAKAAIRASDWSAAVDAAERALAVDPKSAIAHYIAGTALLRLGRLDDAEPHLLTVEEIAPKFGGLNFQLGYLAYSRAESLVQNGDEENAKPFYRQSAERFAAELERVPNQIASLSSRATALAKAGDVDASIQAHEAWIAAEPASNGPLLSLGSVLAKAGRADEAAAILERLPVKDASTVANAALTLGSLLYELEPPSKALPLLQKAVELNPNLTNAQGKVVGVWAKSFDLDQTAAALKRFLELNPSQDEAEQVGELIKDKFTSSADASAPHVDRLALPRYPKQARQNNIKTDVLVLARVSTAAKVLETIVVPNRIWQEIRSLGFEEAAFDCVRRSRFHSGVGPDGNPVEKWAIAKVPFEP